MVFTQGPLSLGKSFDHERRSLRRRFTPMETAAHPRSLFKRRSVGTMIGDSTSFSSAGAGVVKTFRCAAQVAGDS